MAVDGLAEHEGVWSHMVLNMPRSAVKVNPMTTTDFIFTMFRSRLLFRNCSSCLSSFFLLRAAETFVSPICSFLRSTAGDKFDLVLNIHEFPYRKNFKDMEVSIGGLTEAVIYPATRSLLTFLALLLHNGLESLVVVSPVNQDIQDP